MHTGIEMIAFERERQISSEGWTADHDDKHDDHELAMAAVVYTLPSWRRLYRAEGMWPWGMESFKPTPDRRVRELVKAGALIAAEIDRLLRRDNPNSSGSED